MISAAVCQALCEDHQEWRWR